MDVIVVPCTQEKIWSENPGAGRVPARDAYTRPDFLAWRKHAEQSGCPWFILSTRYGLTAPETLIENYNVPVSRAVNDPKFLKLLAKQGRDLDLGKYENVVLMDWRRFEPLVRAALPDPQRFQLRRLLYED